MGLADQNTYVINTYIGRLAPPLYKILGHTPSPRSESGQTFSRMRSTGISDLLLPAKINQRLALMQPFAGIGTLDGWGCESARTPVPNSTILDICLKFNFSRAQYNSTQYVYYPDSARS